MISTQNIQTPKWIIVINHHQTCTLLDHYHYQVIVNLLNLGFSTKCPLNGITSQFGTHKVAHITSQKQNPNPKLVSATLLCIVVPLSKYIFIYILDYYCYYYYYYKNVSGYGPLCLVHRFQYIVIMRLLVACCCLSLPPRVPNFFSEENDHRRGKHWKSFGFHT